MGRSRRRKGWSEGLEVEVEAGLEVEFEGGVEMFVSRSKVG